MARNAELIRQWEILRSIDAARVGIPIAKLAAERGVHERTIRRDLYALCHAGFPLRDERVNGTSMWKLERRPFERLEQTGLSLTEICALYLSRAMLGALGADPLLHDAERAYMKIERALPASCRKFLDELPRVVKAKATARKKQDERKTREVVSRIVHAILHNLQVDMRYRKSYTVHPHRLIHALGGMYLMAFVPTYDEMRTFAIERIQTLSLTGETFSPRALPVEPFAHSLGVNTGTPETVVVEFDAEAARYVREREWHASQQIDERSDGSLVLTLNVCNDYALRTWILGFGPSARVVEPLALAEHIFDAVNETRRRYVRLRTEHQNVRRTLNFPASAVGT